MAVRVKSVEELKAAVQRAETALSNANDRGASEAVIQRAETRLSNAIGRLDRYYTTAPKPCSICGFRGICARCRP